MNMVCEFDLLNHPSVAFNLSGAPVELHLVERTRYTLLLTIQHKLQKLDSMLDELRFEVRLYLDARVAEVTSYQGARRLQAKYPYPNKGMHHPDEKRQTNLVLYDWLSTCSRLNFSQSGYDRIPRQTLQT